MDLKAGSLVVPATHFEPGAPAYVAERLDDELRLLPGWLGLLEVGSGVDVNGTQPPKRTTVEPGSARG